MSRKVLRRRQHRWVGDLNHSAAVEPVEASAQAGAIGAELAELDPVALVDIGRQQERPLHAVGAVAGRPEQLEAGERFVIGPGLQAQPARREAKAWPAGIAEAAIDAVDDVERLATPQLHLDDNRSPPADERPPRLRP